MFRSKYANATFYVIVALCTLLFIVSIVLVQKPREVVVEKRVEVPVEIKVPLIIQAPTKVVKKKAPSEGYVISKDGCLFYGYRDKGLVPLKKDSLCS